MTDPLARVNVEIGATNDKLKKAVQESRTEVEKVGDSSNKAGREATDAFNKAGTAIEEKTAGIRKLQGAISSTIGVVTGFAGAVTLVAGVILSLKNRSESLTETLRQQRRAYRDLTADIEDFKTAQFKSVEEFQSSFDTIVQAIDDARNLTREQRDQLFKETQDFLKRNMAAVQEREDRLSKGRAVERRRQMLREAEQTKRQLESTLLDLSSAWLPDEEVIKERYRILGEELNNIIGDGFFDEIDPAVTDRFLDRARELVEKRKQFEIEASRERIREEEAAEIDKAERVAKAAGDAMQRELQRAFDSVNASFGFNFTDAADAIAAAINRSASRRGRQ